MAYFSKASIIDDHGNNITGTIMGQIKSATHFRLSGGVFNDSILDTNFYTPTTATSGTATVTKGELICSITSASGSAACVSSARPARYMGSSSNYFRGVIRVGDTGSTNNVRQWGAFTGTNSPVDGFFFQLSGTTFSVCSRASSGTINSVASGNFNGKYTTYALDTNYHTYEIHFTNRTVKFIIDGVLIHTMHATTSVLSGSLHLNANMTNMNTGAGSAVSIYCTVMSIVRLGDLHSNPKYSHIATATTTLLKTGPGYIQRVVLNTPSGIITIYDNTLGSGTVIAAINGDSLTVPTTLTYDLNFYSGLTVVTSKTCDITVIYE